MKLANWFKIVWWIISMLITGFLLYSQIDIIKGGKSTNIDIFIFLIFTILLLLPLFSEFEFFGIKLKKDIDEIKKSIDIKFGEIKNEIQNSQSVTTNITAFGPPSSEDKIKELEVKINKIVMKSANDKSVVSSAENTNSPLHSRIYVPENNIMMFKIRFNLENEIKRIWKQNFSGIDERPKPSIKLMQDLIQTGIIDQDLYNILREILSISNIGIHGDILTDEQVNFVLKHAKEMIDYLKNFN